MSKKALVGRFKSATRAQLIGKLNARDLAERGAQGRIKAKLLDRFEEDLDWWYEQIKHLALHAKNEDLPRVNLISRMLDKVLPNLKEVQRPVEAGEVGGTYLQVNVAGRGTIEARTAMQTLNQRRFAAGGLTPSAAPVPVEEGDGAAGVRTEPLGGAVSPGD